MSDLDGMSAAARLWPDEPIGVDRDCGDMDRFRAVLPPVGTCMPIDVRSLSQPCEIAFAQAPASPGRLRRIVQAAVRTWRALIDWRQRARERRELMSLDERLLRDIGLSRGEVRRF